MLFLYSRSGKLIVESLVKGPHRKVVESRKLARERL
jgi:hypothetical protein